MPLLALLLLACKPGLEPVFSACDPLDDARCLLPWPSSFHLKEADTPTGYQVDIDPEAMPMNRDAVRMDPKWWNEKDGFSIAGPLLVYLPDLSLDGVVGHENLADYAAADAKVVLVDVQTHQRVPVWAELDMTAESDAERLLTIWPAAPLEHGKRYAVGLRGLVTTAGAPIQPSDAFRELRDDEKSDTWDVEGRRDTFDDLVFPALDAVGAPRADLQLAWDFVTASRENQLGRMLWMRDDALARVGERPAYALRYTDNDCATEHIGRHVVIDVPVPYYTEKDATNQVLTRDDAGMPYYVGDTEMTVVVRVPCSLMAAPEPRPIVQYGHGLLGDTTEMYTGWMGKFQDENKFVFGGTTLTGMSVEDTPAITVNITVDPTGFVIVPERLHQGFVQQWITTRVLQAIATDPALNFPDADGVQTPVIDPNQVEYYGISQGGIMGSVIVGGSDVIDRGVLGVAGNPYPLMLFRSHDFEDFFKIFREKFTDQDPNTLSPDHRDITLILAMLEVLWEPAEGAGWVGEIANDPDKRVLIQNAIGDAQVSTLGGHWLARGVGATTIAPQTRPLFGIEEAASGHEGSAIVEWIYTDVPDEPVVNLPPALDSDTHECPRRQSDGQRQVIEFLGTGVVLQTCDGPCTATRAGTCG